MRGNGSTTSNRPAHRAGITLPGLLGEAGRLEEAKHMGMLSDKVAFVTGGGSGFGGCRSPTQRFIHPSAPPQLVADTMIDVLSEVRPS